MASVNHQLTLQLKETGTIKILKVQGSMAMVSSGAILFLLGM